MDGECKVLLKRKYIIVVFLVLCGMSSISHARVPDRFESLRVFHQDACYNYGFNRAYIKDADRVERLEKNPEDLIKAANNGDAAAMFQYGYRLYFEHYSDEEKRNEALELMTKAAESGNYYARFNMMDQYVSGALTGKVNYLEAIRWGKKLAFAGSTLAQYSVGEALMKSSTEDGIVNSVLSHGLSYFIKREYSFHYLWLAARQGHKKKVKGYKYFISKLKDNL